MKKYDVVDTRNLGDIQVGNFNKEKIRSFKLCYKINKTNPFGKRYSRLINKLFRKNITKDVELRAPIHITPASNLTLGKGICINYNFCCMARAKVVIEDNVYIGPNSSVITANHDFVNHKIIKAAPINIGKNAWLGANVIVLPGVTIGENAVVGAGSVVTKDVEPFTVVAGNPARYIKDVER